jgi:uncharacterized protein (TIGR03382 family)
MWMMLLVCVAQAELEMEPADGRCVPGEEVALYAPAFDTGGPWACAWSADDGFAEMEERSWEGDALVLTCRDCGRRRADEVYGVYAYCTGEDSNAVWFFDEIVLACSEIDDEPRGCACGSTVAPALWALVVGPALVVLRRRRHL